MIRKSIDAANRELQGGNRGGGHTSRRLDGSNPELRERTKLLVMIDGGRHVTILASRRDVDVLFVNVPSHNACNAAAVNELVQLSLPECYRRLIADGNVVAVGEAVDQNAVDVAARVAMVNLADALAISREPHDRVTPREALAAGLGVSR